MQPGRGDGMRVVVDSGRNSLRLLIPPAVVAAPVSAVARPIVRMHRAILDVGEAGRLLGLEVEAEVEAPEGHDPVDPWYLELEDAPGDQFRSVAVTVEVAHDAVGQPVWVELPRRGEGYELTFPIGNQCWVRPRRRTG